MHMQIQDGGCRHLWCVIRHFRPPTSPRRPLDGLYLPWQWHNDSVRCDRDIAILRHSSFDWKMPIHIPFGQSLGIIGGGGPKLTTNGLVFTLCSFNSVLLYLKWNKITLFASQKLSFTTQQCLTGESRPRLARGITSLIVSTEAPGYNAPPGEWNAYLRHSNRPTVRDH